MKATAFLLCLMALCVFKTSAQTITHVEIVGPTTVIAGDRALYSVNFWDGASMVYPSGNGIWYYWNHTGAISNSSYYNFIDLKFTSTGIQTITYHYMSSGNNFYASMQVQVTCGDIDASAPDAYRAGPGPVILTADTAPPGFIYQWYASNQTTLLSGNQSYTTPSLSVTETYYLAYKNTGSGCITSKVPVRAVISDHNFVKKYTARVATAIETTVRTGSPSQSYKDFTYFDGVGRPKQNVRKQASTNGWDLVTPIVYDTEGRQGKEYLPYAQNYGTTSGTYRETALEDHVSYYNTNYSDIYGYSQKKFEPSPLNRVEKQAAPGNSWRLGSGREINYAERPNTVEDGVRVWTLDDSGFPVTTAAYAAGTLWAKTTTDENHHLSVEFTDTRGRTVLKKVQIDPSPSAGHTGWLCTYYAYDEFGDLRVVIPPKAVQALHANWSLSTNTVMADGQYFLYKYDERRRLAEKKVPGRGWEHLVYDKKDRLVAVQNAVQRQQGQWEYTEYDALGRPVITGIFNDTRPRATLQADVNGRASNDAKLPAGPVRVGRNRNILPHKDHVPVEDLAFGSIILTPRLGIKDLDNKIPIDKIGQIASGAAGTFPSDERDILTEMYYDNYDKTELGSYKKPSGYHDFSERTTGLLTGKLVRDLETGVLYETVYYYDRFGREIQRLSEHHLGGTVRHSTKYNFEGKPTETQTVFEGSQNYTVTRTFAYNASGDLAAITHKVNSNPTVTLASQSYNELGQLINKSHPGVGVTNTYTYNIRGWNKRINSPGGSDALFGMELFYESGASTNLWNGNISRMDWKGQDKVTRSYNYSYDLAERVTGAAYSVPLSLADDNRYSLGGITYDPNGNITAMQRRNQLTSTTYGIVDNLSYTYDTHGNRLLQVADSEGSMSYTSKDFKDRSSTDYTYDANGNLTANADKQIANIVYNHLDLPAEVVFTGSTGKILYTYDAEGNKLRQKVYNGSGSPVSTTDYIGEFVFRDAQLEYLIHEEGRAVFEDGSFRYEFNIKDHLGNVRQVIRAPETDSFMATMEMPAAQQEELNFERLPESRQSGIEHNATPGGDRVAWLNSARGRILGPARTQEVQRGDSIKLSVHGKYRDAQKGKANIGSFITTGAKERLLTDLLEFGRVTARSAEPNAIALFNIIDLLVKNLQQKDAPEAYMMYALYNSDSVLYKTGKQVLTKNAANRHEELEEDLYISEDGYMEAFLVNETEEDVWFDDFSIQNTSLFIVQETHYDPWGLELTGLGFQSGGVKVNRYLYNGKELVPDLNLNLYDYGARFYDPVIGRWTSPDPMAHLREWVSPYNFVQNNPLNRIDPDGRFDWVVNKDNEVYWDENATSQATTKSGETYLGKTGFGLDEKTGNSLVYNSDGSTTEGIRTLEEVTVTAIQSRHERTMNSPVVKHMQASNARLAREIAPFARHMVRSSIDAAGYTGAGISAAGLVVAPFLPPIGAGMIGVGSSISTVAGVSGSVMSFVEGKSAAGFGQAALVVTGYGGTRYLHNLKRKELISFTDEVILRGVQNSSLDIIDLFLIPKPKSE